MKTTTKWKTMRCGWSSRNRWWWQRPSGLYCLRSSPINHKKVANNKSLSVHEGLRRMLDMWLKKDAQTQLDNVINLFAKKNNNGSLNTTQQLEEDKAFSGTFVIAIGFVDFHFFSKVWRRGQGQEYDQSYLVCNMINPDWFCGLSTVHVWVFIVDLENSKTPLSFMCQLPKSIQTHISPSLLSMCLVLLKIFERTQISKRGETSPLWLSFFFCQQEQSSKGVPICFISSRFAMIHC